MYPDSAQVTIKMNDDKMLTDKKQHERIFNIGDAIDVVNFQQKTFVQVS